MNVKCHCGITMVQMSDDVEIRGITVATPNGKFFCVRCTDNAKAVLEACKLMVAHFERFCDDRKDGPILDLARAVIKKASTK